MKHVIVSGANGNLGKAVVSKFLAEGYSVSGTVIPQEQNEEMFDHPLFEKRVIDLGDENATGLMVNDIIEKKRTYRYCCINSRWFCHGEFRKDHFRRYSQSVSIEFRNCVPPGATCVPANVKAGFRKNVFHWKPPRTYGP